MREINTETSDHVFKIGIKEKGSIFVDGFEFSQVCADFDTVKNGEEPTSKEMAKAIRDIAWGGEITLFSDYELSSVGIKILLEIRKLGNE